MSPFRGISRNEILILVTIFAQYLPSNFVYALPNGPGLVGIIPPPQVLLPPHREEGQSLDDIIYGTSFSGRSLFPSALGSREPIHIPTTTTTIRPSSSFLTSSRTTSQSSPPPPPSPSSFSPQLIFNRGSSNSKLVQTFIPPSPASLSPTTTNSIPFQPNSIFATSSSRPSFPLSSHPSPSSTEEIKVPQAVKHRTPQRKQYTKADLIAAANSLKPAGFDFNRVVTSNSFVPVTSFSNKTSNNLYNNARFPLPLFDTPVFNELKPFMEMLLRHRQQQQQQQQQSQQQSQLINNNNKKVLVIIPKNSGLDKSSRNNGRSIITTNTNTATRQPKQLSSRFISPSISDSSRSTSLVKSPSPSKFTVPPKTIKLSTTTKPKPSNLSTTKRSSSKLSEITKKLEKNPDLQVAATSNKCKKSPQRQNISQQRSTVGKSLSSSGDSDKRSYSIKGPENYSFSYEVKNDAYGDFKSHSESKTGDQVFGEYSMLEADGYTRVVKYTVDSDQGFKASVKRIPPS